MLKKLQSLHCHTILSDGLMTHQQVLHEAYKNNITTVAFTDHDVLPDKKIITQLEKQKNPVKYIWGIELTCGDAEMFHVIGLFIDPYNKPLLTHCQKILKQRKMGAQKTINHLQSLGFDITFEKVQGFAKGPSIVWPHIVSALLSKQQNIKLMEKYLSKAQKNSRENPTLKENYQMMMDQGPPQYPYRLFLKEDSFFPPPPRKHNYPNLDKVVSLIRKAGGLAVIAHYSSIRDRVSISDIEKLLKQDRIDGMEIVFGLWAFETVQEEKIKNDRQEIKRLVKKYNKIAAGGGDFHQKKDFRRYVQANWYSKDSIGLYEKILQKYPQYSICRGERN